MEFVDVIFVVGITFIVLGVASGLVIFLRSLRSRGNPIRDVDAVNLWILVAGGIPVGLVMVFFWF